MGSNKLLPIVAGVVLLMVAFTAIKSCNPNDKANVLLGRVPKTPTPDADSPADTIRTLTAEVAAIKGQNLALERQNAQLLQQRNQIASQVSKEVKDSLRLERFQQNEPLLDQMTAKFDQLKIRLDEVSAAQNSTINLNSSEIPVGLGLDGIGSNNADALIWVEPLGTGQAISDNSKHLNNPTSKHDTGSLLHTDTSALNTSEAYLEASEPAPDPEDTPAYTIPRNATLVGSTGMTALIGRIPFNGAINDPFPFKVIVGRDNLAANGIEIPGLYGMIFSGKASGDWALSCVRGTLQSATVVFDDGTIRTLSSDDQSLQQNQKDHNGGGSSERDLGWISDRRGIPCVTGTRISNAADYLTGRILARAVEAGAKAFAQNETTQIVSPVLGAATSVVTGDQLKFAGFNALSGGADEISLYLAERAAQSFDVVYVDTGIELAVHIDQELPIDYETHGRKTSYALYESSTDRPLD